MISNPFTVRLFVLVLGLLTFLACFYPHIGNAQSSITICGHHYFLESPPRIIRPNMAHSARELCSDEFAVLHSSRTRTPLYSAERLTRDKVIAARDLEREELFHEETRLPDADRASLVDYRRSGFDRGHMAASGNMATPQGRYQSFSLANIIPQNPDNNQRIWCSIESTVRDLAIKHDEVWVVTGPLFIGATVTALNRKVWVPTHIFKAVMTRARVAGVYVTANREGGTWQAISFSDLADLSGIEVFPGLPQKDKVAEPNVPAPTRLCRGAAPQRGMVLSDMPATHQFAGVNALNQQNTEQAARRPMPTDLANWSREAQKMLHYLQHGR